MDDPFVQSYLETSLNCSRFVLTDRGSGGVGEPRVEEQVDDRRPLSRPTQVQGDV